VSRQLKFRNFGFSAMKIASNPHIAYYTET
jgi:hypothetical protein